MNYDDEFIDQLARWSIIGRLTGSLFHEINNPLQAICGAMSLAAEDLHDPELMGTYVNLTQEESARILTLIARAGRVYSPEKTKVEPIDVNFLLQECVALTRKEMQRKNVDLTMDLGEGGIPIQSVFSEFSLAFLCPIIEISDKLVGTQSGKIDIRTRYEDGFHYVVISTPTIPLPANGFRLIVCRNVIEKWGGSLVQEQVADGAVINISIPVEQ
jgi:nitrogen-specific signal transduction histidine kinase